MAQHGAVSGEVGVRDRFCTRGWWAWPQILEFRECFGTALRHRVWMVVSGPVQSWELDSVFLVDPFQLRIVSDSTKIKSQPVNIELTEQQLTADTSF